MKTIQDQTLLLLIVSILVFCSSVAADTKIAVLDFELDDSTLLPDTEKERSRTASIKPLLEQALNQIGNYDIVQINRAEQEAANAGFGYLFQFHDVAAKLGKQFDAEWIIVTQHNKPSTLFSYLIANVVDVETGKRTAKYSIELKGTHKTVTERGVKGLAREINNTIIRKQKSKD